MIDPRRVKITTQPSIEPVSLSEAKLHCRIDASTEETLVSAWITAARIHCEQVARRSFITRTYTAYLDYWPHSIFELPYPPMLAVSSIKYYDDQGGAAVTFSASNYQVDAHSEPGRVALKLNSSWPSTILRDLNGVEIIYTAGYGANTTDVPETYRSAIKLYVGSLYENRESLTTGQGIAVIPNPDFDRLLMTDRGGW